MTRAALGAWIAGVVLVLTGCASLDQQLQSADATCHQSAAMTAFVTCLNAAEAPVWQKQPAEDLEDWRTFAAARMGLAQDLDAGKINAAQFADSAAKASTQFRTDLTQDARRQMRKQEELANQAHDQDKLQQIQDQMKQLPPDGMSGMGMNDNMPM